MRSSRMSVFGVVVFASMQIVGCSKSESDSSADADTILTGTWIESCTQDKSNGTVVGSHKSSMVYGKTDLLTTAEMFTDGACATAAMKMVYGANYTIGGDVATATGAKELDLTITKYTVTIQSDTYITAFNSQSFCEIKDWVKNTERDILGKKCGTDTVSSGDKSYDIFKILTDGKTVQNGTNDSTKDGKTAANRPITIDTTSTWTKQ